jgi:methionine-rich copper-binding protein CopC
VRVQWDADFVSVLVLVCLLSVSRLPAAHAMVVSSRPGQGRRRREGARVGKFIESRQGSHSLRCSACIVVSAQAGRRGEEGNARRSSAWVRRMLVGPADALPPVSWFLVLVSLFLLFFSFSLHFP